MIWRIMCLMAAASYMAAASFNVAHDVQVDEESLDNVNVTVGPLKGKTQTITLDQIGLGTVNFSRFKIGSGHVVSLVANVAGSKKRGLHLRIQSSTMCLGGELRIDTPGLQVFLCIGERSNDMEVCGGWLNAGGGEFISMHPIYINRVPQLGWGAWEWDHAY